MTLEPDAAPFAYSPMVLSLPQGIAEDSQRDRTGDSLAGLRAKLARRDKSASVRRPDPEYTDSALLATVGLYGPGRADVGLVCRVAWPRQDRPRPPPATCSCALPDNADTDREHRGPRTGVPHGEPGRLRPDDTHPADGRVPR